MDRKVSAITIADVPAVFNDDRLCELAQLATLEADADLDLFSTIVLDGVRQYAQYRLSPPPSDNEVHGHIEAVERAASREQYEDVASLLWSLSPAARAARGWLSERLTTPAWRRRGVMLPDAATLRDPTHQREACVIVRKLCTFGGEAREGRRRPNGKRSRKTLKPLLYDPTPTTRVLRREAELELVNILQYAIYQAAGREPAWTARHDSPHAAAGPLARMTKEVLRLVGAPHDADAVGLINELHKRRCEIRRRPGAHHQDELGV
jgi:hypothetical protein